MLAYLEGEILKKTAKGIIILTNDIGYFIHTSQSTLGRLEGQKTAQLFLHHQVKEDASDLYGFEKYEDLEFFNQLISINGVGPKVALDMLNTNSDELRKAIINEDEAFICHMKGIGKKTAQRVILELKEKIKDFSNNLGEYVNVSETKHEEAIEALTRLGYQRKAVLSALKEMPKTLNTSEEIITHFLKTA